MGQMTKICKHNIKISTINSVTTIRFHSTDVVVIDRNKGIVTLNSGHWRTVTTKARMNQVAYELGLGYRVFQRDFEWYVDIFNSSADFCEGDYKTLNFYDGIEVKL